MVVPKAQKLVWEVPSIKETSHRKLIEQAFEEFKEISESKTGWKEARKYGASPIFLNYRRDTPNERKDATADEVTTIRCSVAVPYPPERVFQLLADGSRQREWNHKYQGGEVLRVIDESSEVVRCLFKSCSSPYKYREFNLLKAWHQTPGGEHTCVFRSIASDKPPREGHVHAVLLPSGFSVAPLPVESAQSRPPVVKAGMSKAKLVAPAPSAVASLVTCVLQLDKEGVLVVSPDLLGESSELQDSLMNLSTLLGIDDHMLETGTSMPSPHARVPAVNNFVQPQNSNGVHRRGTSSAFSSSAAAAPASPGGMPAAGIRSSLHVTGVRSGLTPREVRSRRAENSAEEERRRAAATAAHAAKMGHHGTPDIASTPPSIAPPAVPDEPEYDAPSPSPAMARHSSRSALTSHPSAASNNGYRSPRTVSHAVNNSTIGPRGHLRAHQQQQYQHHQQQQQRSAAAAGGVRGHRPNLTVYNAPAS